jgi:predicted dehydrogenase
MIEAARRYTRIVQVGTQRRSGIVLGKAVQFLRDGGLGQINSAKAVIYRRRDPIGVVADSPVPPGVRYDLWLGPAPQRPFNEQHFHYHWHFFWEYGTSDLGNTAVHSLDALRWLIGKQEHPRTAYSIGGLYEAGATTDQKTPNTQQAAYQYADGTELHCDLRNWHSGPAEAQGLFVWIERLDEGRRRGAQVYLGEEPARPRRGDRRQTGRGQTHVENFIERARPQAGRPQRDHRGRALLDGDLSSGNISCGSDDR